ncbi:biotin/lipoyl-containing protein, partial [Bauldia litoralis]
MAEIQPITMPKWGLAMEEGMLARWAVDIGTPIELGQEIMDIETSKIANVFESPVTGVLRRRVVADGDTVPVGALLGVVAAPDVSEEAVDDFVRTFLEGFVPEEAGAASGPSAETVEAG